MWREFRGEDFDMATLARRKVLALLGAGGGLFAVGYALRGIIGAPRLNPLSNWVAHADAPDSAVRPAWT